MRRIMLAVMALLVLLTGCGQTADSEPPEPENVPDVPAQEEPAPPEPVLPQDTADAAIRSASIRDNLLFICASSKINIFFCLVKRNIAVD